MNAMPDSIIVNSCQYTPVYLIEDPGASQGQSYFITQANVEKLKPVSDNLKSFYESSGNIENSFINVLSSTKPRILKKQDSGVVGNNLKLANFLLPKNENSNKHQYLRNNVILKPNVTLNSSTHTNNATNNTISNPVANTVPSVSTTSTINTVPRLNIDSKIVKLKDTTFNGTTLKTVDSRRYNRVEKASPKIKPKEIPPILQGAPKCTNVQLLKLGETYHRYNYVLYYSYCKSLNQLSHEQMKMVTQALKIFSNPEKIAPEPVYDPVTNAQFIYKVVSPRDLTVVGKNKVVTKERKQIHEPNTEGILKLDSKKEHIVKPEPRRETLTKAILKKDIVYKDVVAKKESVGKDVPKENLLKNELKKDISKQEGKKENTWKHEMRKENLIRKSEEKLLKQKIQIELEEEQEMAEAYNESSEPKVTRSGRKVKLPKLSFPEGIPHKAKKRTTFVRCFQCVADFPSLYRLQKHYEAHPTHIPAKIHSNLFHCLLAIVKSGSEGDRINIFIQQLEQLIVKLRSLLPCVLKNSAEEGKSCTISEDVGKLLGLNPGKYHLDIEALNCVKNNDGYCNHNPPPPKDIIQEANGAQPRITMNNEDILANSEVDTEDCARINSVDKWPTVNKRVWKQKKEKSQENAKRMRLASENCDTLIELGMDDIVNSGKPNKCSEEQIPIIEQGAVQQKSEFNVVVKAELDDFPDREICANIVEEDPSDACTYDQPVEAAVVHTDAIDNKNKHSNHMNFHSTHFDIRSSPIKPTSTIFRKFQINPELLAKYEAQIIRSIETVDKDHDSNKEMPCPTVEEVLRTNESTAHNGTELLHNSKNVSQTSKMDNLNTENVRETSADISHTNQNILQTSQVLHSKQNSFENSTDILQTKNDAIRNSREVLHSNDVLHTSTDILHSEENVLQTSHNIIHTNDNALNQDVQTKNVRDVLVNDDTLQEIFRDEDLSAVKESFILDRELKDWILNRSNDEKSEDGFSRSTSLIEPALLHVRDDEIKSQLDIGQKVDLPTNDNHDDSSVLNFLDTLATDSLSYPGTEIRVGDFQLDLFSFHSS